VKSNHQANSFLTADHLRNEKIPSSLFLRNVAFDGRSFFGQGGKNPDHLFHPVGTKRIVDPKSFFSTRDEAGTGKYFHVIGKRRLRKMKMLENFTGAFFPVTKNQKNLQPGPVGKRSAYVRA